MTAVSGDEGAHRLSLTARANVVVFAFLVALAIAAAWSASAKAHSNGSGWGSVFSNADGSEYIGYGDYTTYAYYYDETQDAIAEWNYVNEYNDYWGVDIYADYAGTLDISEFDGPTYSYYAVWDPSGTPDDIWLNRANMQELSPPKQYSTVLHEFGHALGFDDLYWSDENGYDYCGDTWCRDVSLMYNEPSDYYWYYAPQSHDYDDYEDAWYWYP